MQCQESHEAGTGEKIFALCVYPQCPKRYLCSLCFCEEFHQNHFSYVKPIDIFLNEIRAEINKHKANDMESILVSIKAQFDMMKNDILHEINRIEFVFQENIKQIRNNQIGTNEQIQIFEKIANCQIFDAAFGDTIVKLVKHVNEGLFKDFQCQNFETLQNSINKLQKILNFVSSHRNPNEKEKEKEKDKKKEHSKDKDNGNGKEKERERDKEKQKEKEKEKQKTTPLSESTAINPYFQKLQSFYEKKRFNYDETPLELSQIRGTNKTDKMVGSQYYRGEIKTIVTNNGNKQNIRYGRGLLIDQKEELILEGIWEDQEMRFGYKFYLDFKKKPSVKIGFFKHWKLQGKGNLILLNGHRYSGDFKDDKKSGKGVEHWVEGTYYEGEYSNDLRNGRGRYYFSVKEYLECGWLNDYQHGEGVYVDSKGQKLVGTYEMGKKVGIHKLYKNIDDKEPFEFQKYQNGKLIDSKTVNDIQQLL